MSDDLMPIKILAALRSETNGLTRSQIRDLVGGRVTKERIEITLNRLAAYGLARMTVERDTGGRPKERWRAT